MKSPLVLFAFLIVASTCGDAASTTNNEDACSAGYADAFSALSQASGLVSTTAMYETSGDVPILLSAFRCVVSAPDPMPGLRRLLEEGSAASRLYALVALRVMNPKEFARRIPFYLSSKGEVHLLGGDVDSLRPISEVARHIQEGEYSVLLPSSIYKPSVPEGRIEPAQ
jgi:hypothetical protein